jgi:hypothetical protein
MRVGQSRGTGSVLTLLLVGHFFGAVACNDGTAAQHTGTARVVVRPLVPETYIARMTVTITGGTSDPTFTPMTADLARSDAQWAGRISGIPVGPQREFSAIAFDAQDNALFTTFGRADIAQDAATVVSLTLDNRPPATVQNAFPIVESVSWLPDPPTTSSVVQLQVTARDPDPTTTLHYAWTASCGTFDNAASATPKWTAPATPQTCQFTVAVTDGHGATVGFDFGLMVVSTTGDAGVVVSVNSWPVISSLSGTLVVSGATMDGDLVVQAFDPDGQALSYSWESTCGGIVFKLNSPYTVPTPHITLPLASTPCTVTVSVYDGVSPGATTGTLFLSPEVVRLNCQNVVCPVGQVCDPTSGLCEPTSCTPACSGKVCGSDGCGGSCGTCASGTTCNSSGQCVSSCTPSCSGRMCGDDGCGGSCGICATGSTCNASGQCVSTCTPSCSGRACGDDGCGGSCGTCATGTTCNASGQCVCTPQCSGRVCGDDGCGGSCGTCASGVCTANGQCQTSATVVTPAEARDLQISPPAALAIDPSGITYVGSTIAIPVAANFQTNPSGPPIFLQSNGGNDIFAAAYDATGNILFGVAIGDDGGPGTTTDQTATGAAITADGKLALIGKITGTVTFGSNTVIGASPVAYLAALSGTDGTRLWGKGFNLGSNGAFRSVSANPQDGQHRIAVCGSASNAATQLVPGTTLGGAIDLVVAAFDSSGNRLWSQQIGGTGNESCSSITVDANGDVFAAGQFDGASLTFCPTGSSSNGVACGGTPIALAGPGTTARKFIWVAKFDGATGKTLAAVAYSGGAGVANPVALTTTPSGDAVLGGSFSGQLTIGAMFTSNGSDDAFVARLDHATLAPVGNAIAWGGTASDVVRGVATTSSGDILVSGVVNPSTSAFRAANGGHDSAGALSLNVNGAVSPDIFVAKFNGQTYIADGASTYGDTGIQSGDQIVCNRFSSANQVTFSATMSGSATFGAAGTLTAVNISDGALVFSHLQ